MHSVQLTKGLFRNFSAAFFVFFAAAAGTRIIRTDFLFGVSELFGFTPLFCYLAAAFRRKHAVPFAKIVLCEGGGWQGYLPAQAGAGWQ